MKERLNNKPQTNVSHTYDWSRDNITTNLPAKARQWLDSYEITQEECRQHRLFYDRDRDLLILPIYDGERLLTTNGRYFGTNPKHPKYITKGYKTHFKIVKPPQPSNIWVLTEDYLSAVKVGRTANAIPLLGTHVPRSLVLSLVSKRPVLRLWLDFDKATEAAKQAAQIRQYIPNTATIVSPNDPKSYSNTEIIKFISDTLLQPTEGIPQQGNV